MASEYTPNYNLDLYVSTDKPNLRDQYNAAMGKIDTQMKVNADGVTNANANVLTLQTKMTEVEGNISDLTGTVNGFDSAIKSAQSTADAAQAAASKNAGDITTVNGTVSGIQDDITDLQNDVSAVRGSVSTETSARQSADTALGNRIDQTNAAVAALETRKFEKIVFIGDSWGLGYYGGVDHANDGWPVYLAQAFGVSSGNYVNVSADGWGIVEFTSALNTAKSSIANPDLVVIMGGQNDRDQVGTSGLPSFGGKCSTFFQTLDSTFPDAEKHFFLCPLGYNHYEAPGTVNSPYITVCQEYKNGARNHDVKFHEGCLTWGDWVGSDNADTDTRHLLASGYRMVAKLMHQLIVYGGDFWRSGSGLLTLQGDFSLASAQLRCYENNGTVTITLGGSCNGAVTGTTGNQKDIATLPDGFGSLATRFISTTTRNTTPNAIQLRLEGQKITLVSGTIASGDLLGVVFTFPSHS